MAANDDFQGVRDSDARADVILPQDGIYQIEVRGAQDHTSGPYTLEIEAVQIAAERSRHTLEEGAGFETIAVSGDGHQVLGARTSVVPFFGGKAFDSSVIAWNVDRAGHFRERCRFGTGAEEHAEQGEPSLQFSPDEQTVMSGSWDATMILWDLASCQKIGESFVGHRWLVSGIAFTPDGTRVLSGSYDGTARLWDVDTHAELQRFDLGLYVSGVDIGSDGTTAVLVSHAGVVALVDLTTGQEIRRMVDADTPRKVALSPDGRTVASGNVRGDIILWDLATGQAVRRLRGHGCDIASLEFSADGRYILSSSCDYTGRLWEVATGKELVRFIHDREATGAYITGDGRSVFSGSLDGTLRMWDVPELAKEEQ